MGASQGTTDQDSIIDKNWYRVHHCKELPSKRKSVNADGNELQWVIEQSISEMLLDTRRKHTYGSPQSKSVSSLRNSDPHVGTNRHPQCSYMGKALIN